MSFIRVSLRRDEVTRLPLCGSLIALSQYHGHYRDGRCDSSIRLERNCKLPGGSLYGNHRAVGAEEKEIWYRGKSDSSAYMGLGVLFYLKNEIDNKL